MGQEVIQPSKASKLEVSASTERSSHYAFSLPQGLANFLCKGLGSK